MIPLTGALCIEKEPTNMEGGGERKREREKERE
jgi:hypothetical protein